MHDSELPIMKPNVVKGAKTAVAPMQLGQKVRQLRLEQSLTLEEASQLTGLARSTLSKIENGHISPTFSAVQKLVAGLKIDMPQLFAPPKEQQTAGRRDITRKGEGTPYPTPTYEHELLADQLTHKKMVPFKTRVHARSFTDYEAWVRHEGEEFLLVLQGEVLFFSEFYEPLTLQEGDSIYYDCGMGHALVSSSEEDAYILWVTA